MPVTIKDIAKRLCVSNVTVSKALRGQPPISQQMQEKVKKVAREMGYRPNVFGRGLQGGRTHSLGILWSLCGPHPSLNITRELTLRAMHRQYISYVVDSLNDPHVIDQSLEDFAQRRVDAVIVQHNHPEEIESRLLGFPAAVVVSRDHEKLSVDCIHQDRLPGIRQCAQYLISKGRRRPMFLYRAKGNLYKGEAFLAEFEKQGIRISPEAYLDLPSLEDADVLACLEHRFPAGKLPFDAVFCMVDGVALLFMQWLRSHGVKVPEDVAVVGFNDTDYCRWFDPPLASIHRNDEKIVEAADEFIFSRLGNPDRPVRNVTIPMTFVPRKSAE